MGRQGHPVNRHETSAGSTLCARYSGAAPRACNAPLRCNAQRPRQLCVSLLFAAHASGCGRAFASGRGACARDYPHLKNCFVMHARRKAQQADLVVVNHALFFADMMLRESGVQELLPSANTMIFDEAHQLPDTATLFFGETVRSYQWVELARDVRIEGLTHARDGADWTALCAALETAARDLRLAFDERAAKYAFAQLDADHPLHA